MFKIKDLLFTVKNAQLDAFFSKDLLTINWGVDIRSTSSNPEYKRINPKATIEILFSSQAKEMQHWKDISGKKSIGSDSIDFNLMH